MNLLDIAPEKLCEILRVHPQKGLSQDAARRNQKEFGKNTPAASLFQPKKVAKSLFSNVLFCMFFVLCIFSLFTPNRAVSIVCLCTGVSCYVLFYLFCIAKSRPLVQMKEALRAPYTVLRDGRKVSVDSALIVPGDLLLLKRGEAAPCDGILLEAEGLKVCQAQIDARQQRSKYSHREVIESDRDYEACLVYCGSVVTAGTGTLLVCNTGKNIRKTSLSKRFAGDLPRPLKQASDYARRLSLWLLLVSTTIFLTATLMGVDSFSIFFLLCSITVAVLPELCEAICKLAMLLPLSSLARRGCLIQNYACLDELLNVDRILVDSASLFLEEEIRPSHYFYANHLSSVREVSEGLFTLLSYCRLCCEDKPKKKAQMWHGKSSLDAAILRTAPEFGIDRAYLEHTFLPIGRIPFEEVRGFSSALVLQRDKCYQLVRGRPSEVLDRCTHMLQEKRSVALSASAKARLYQAADQMAADGEVVVALARRYFRSPPEDLNLEDASYLTFVGFVTFYTPLRAESAESVANCRKSGVHVMLCTDNDPDATLGIARNMEFFCPEEEQSILTGEKARRMDEKTLSEALGCHKVFCGLSALGKRSVICAQKEQGHTVMACTHSIHDTLSCEAAQVSVVLSSERCSGLIRNADIVLKKDCFELLPEAMRTCRTIFLNSLRILRLSITLMVTLFSCAFFSLFVAEKTLILQPLFVLLLGLFFLFGAITLTADKRLITSIKPLKKNSFLHSSLPSLSAYGAVTGLIGGAVTVLSYRLSLSAGHAQALSAALITLYLSVLWMLFGARKTRPIHKAEFAANGALLFSVPLCVGLLCVLILVEPVRTHLGILPPSGILVALSALLGFLPLLFGELFKFVKLRFGR